MERKGEREKNREKQAKVRRNREREIMRIMSAMEASYNGSLAMKMSQTQ